MTQIGESTRSSWNNGGAKVANFELFQVNMTNIATLSLDRGDGASYAINELIGITVSDGFKDTSDSRDYVIVHVSNPNRGFQCDVTLRETDSHTFTFSGEIRVVALEPANCPGEVSGNTGDQVRISYTYFSGFLRTSPIIKTAIVGAGPTTTATTTTTTQTTTVTTTSISTTATTQTITQTTTATRTVTTTSISTTVTTTTTTVTTANPNAVMTTTQITTTTQTTTATRTVTAGNPNAVTTTVTLGSAPSTTTRTIATTSTATFTSTLAQKTVTTTMTAQAETSIITERVTETVGLPAEVTYASTAIAAIAITAAAFIAIGKR